MHLVVVMPALNEAATIADVVRAVPRDIASIDRVSVIVVDDGSTDATAAEARSAGAKVVSHGRNLGLGRAFATGVDAALKAGADLMVNIDSDGQFNPGTIPRLIAPILEGKADFVSCSRFGDPALVPVMPAVKLWGNRQMTRLVNLIVRPRKKFTDVSCGFRAYTRETLLRLNLYGSFTYTQETFTDLAYKGLRMEEVPLPVRGVRQFGQSRVARNLWNYALQTSTILLRSLRDYRPLFFFGVLSAAFMILALAQLGVVTIHWLGTGKTTPFTSLIVTGSTTFLSSILLLAVALLADMQGRSRRIQEQLLYLAKRAYYDQSSESVKGSTNQ
ncbi:MAG: glycosyltransferase family 2 protein [Sumerlaeia bacterium]